MFRIDTPTAAETLPAPTAPGTPGYFTGGDPEAGIPPTTISPDILNAFQEELMAILAAAGVAAVKDTNNQVLAALRAMFAPLPTSNGAIVGAWLSMPTTGTTLMLPAGGTWAFFYVNNNTGGVGIAAGGTTVFTGTINNEASLCWRIA